MTAPAPDRYRHLFSPLLIRGHTARNRIVRAPTSCHLGEANLVTDAVIAHYRSLAEGGVGLIVTEGMRVDPRTLGSGTAIAAYRREAVPGLRRLADAIRAAGALIVGQLSHSGRQHTSTQIPGRLVGPSPVACPRSGGVPHPLTVAEIEALIEGFELGARHLHEAGFDGVEIHGAQGHLLMQFVSPFSNQRDDAYGGSLEGRLRLPTEVLRRARATTDDRFIVGYRMGVDEFTQGGITVDDSIEVARIFAAQGLVDYLSLTQGNFNTIDMHLPDRHLGPAPFVHLQARIKAAVPAVVTFANTKIQTPDEAEEVISTGMADAVALGRALTVDPEWPVKAREGAADRIRLCIACNECWAGLHDGTASLTCVQNATVGRELALGPLVPAKRRRRVVIVGGGPGGLEAARVAALRGHRVTLFERSATLGGTVLAGASIEGHAEYGRVAQFLVPEVTAAGVDVRLSTAATVELVSAEQPEAVVLATGASPVAPAIDGDGTVPVVTARSHAELEALPGQNAVVVVDEDGYYWACEITEGLARMGRRVVLVTRHFEPFRELPIVSRIAALRACDETGVTMNVSSLVDRAERGGVVIRRHDSGREEVVRPVDVVVWVGAQRPNDELAAPLRAAGMDVQVIGDAWAPRRVRHAIHEGHAVGRAL